MDEWRVVPLGPAQDRGGFDCGVTALNQYLQRQAGQDVRRRVVSVFVAVAPASPEAITGYYGLGAASFARAELPEDAAKRLPQVPVPAAILGRLAVARSAQGRGLGAFLLMDALHRVVRASSALGIHAVIVDAKDPAAAGFYARYGFRAFPSNALRLFLPLETIIAAGL